MEQAPNVPVIFYDWEVEKKHFSIFTPKYCKGLMANGAYSSLYIGIAGTGLIGDEPYPDHVNERVVFLDHHISKILNKDELKATILHEVGHIVNGDIPPYADWDANGRKMILTTEDQELAADRYAVEHGASPKALRYALRKLVTLYVQRSSEGGGVRGVFRRYVQVVGALCAPTILKRFEALRKMEKQAA